MRTVLILVALAVAGSCRPVSVPTPTDAPNPSLVGAMILDGVVLVPAESSLHAACMRAAQRGAFVVPCPRLVMQHHAPAGETCPAEPYAPNEDCLEDSAAGNPTLPSRHDSFAYIQTDLAFAPARHLFVIGVKADSRLLQFRVGCIGAETTEAGPDVLGSAGTWVECPDEGDAMNSGHLLLRWRMSDVVYAVSLHGHTSTNRALEIAIARNIEYVGP